MSADEYAAPGIRAFRPCVVVRRPADTAPLLWNIPAESWRHITRRRIDEILAAFSLAGASDDALRAAQLRPAEGALLEQRLSFAPEALVPPVEARDIDWPPQDLRGALRRGWLRP